MAILLASAPDLDALRGLVAQFYYTSPEKIKFGDCGTIYKGEKQLSTRYEIKRNRARGFGRGIVPAFFAR